MSNKKLFGVIIMLLTAAVLWPTFYHAHDEPPFPIGDSGSSEAPNGYITANDSIDGISPRMDVREQPLGPPRRAVTTNIVTEQPLRPKIVTINDKQYPLRTYQPLVTPNDPLAGQWWETNAKLTATWGIPIGTADTTIAIIDTGFALDHEEFAGRWDINDGEYGSATSELQSQLNCTARGLPLDASCNLVDDDMDTIVDNELGSIGYQNPSELNCTDQGLPLLKQCNLIDDDANGYADDVSGWDFINYDRSPQAGEINPNGTGTTHGTLVAGVAAATGNNGKGIAGVDWSTNILPLQALDDDSYGDTRSVGRAMFYAIERDVDVISISLGSYYPDEFIREALHAAQAKGITVVAASGNDGCDCIVYPANYPEALAVGALDINNQRASFSSWGQNLDIVAPGTQIISPTWAPDDPTSAYASGVAGTSFSTPMVGGIVTRILSQQPTATPQQLVAAVSENTNRLGITTPHDTRLGFGTLDAHKTSIRMTNTYNQRQMYAFAPVQKGSYLIPDHDVEKNGQYAAYSCEPGSVPSTAIYELKKPGKHFFTVSKTEQQMAINDGYTSNFFSYQCLQMPHDTPLSIRNINIFREFRNIDQPR